jgi:hypothetical protein
MTVKSLMDYRNHIPDNREGADSHIFHALRTGICYSASKHHLYLTDETPTPDDNDDATLDEAAREERKYVRRRLREEFQREPSEEEIDEWLRQHTEGY